MKLMVFEYYNNFYKHVLNEKDYEKNRGQVYRFLIDAAGDGIVPPAILPNSKKLGEERSIVSPEALVGEGILTDGYRNRKLLDYYLETIAIKNDMTLDEVRLLLCLNQPHLCKTRRELADFANLSPRALSILLQKLVHKNLIRVEIVRKTKELKIIFQAISEPILAELADAQNKYEHARFLGFEEDELIQYAQLTEKIKQNIQSILGQ